MYFKRKKFNNADKIITIQVIFEAFGGEFRHKLNSYYVIVVKTITEQRTTEQRIIGVD